METWKGTAAALTAVLATFYEQNSMQLHVCCLFFLAGYLVNVLHSNELRSLIEHFLRYLCCF
jgi:hypothetical protein